MSQRKVTVKFNSEKSTVEISKFLNEFEKVLKPILNGNPISWEIKAKK